MTTLTEFLLARIAEDEETAHRIHHDYQHVLGIPHYFEPVSRGGMVGLTPRAALAECEAKRRIVYFHRLYPPELIADPTCSQCEMDNDPWPCQTLRALALPYVDHPDFRPEWHPDADE